MKTVVKTTLLMFGLTALFLVGAVAEEIPLRGPISFSIYDANSDGYVSEKEFYDTRAKRMEQKAAQGMPMRNAANAPAFSEFDTNKDGKLSEIELLKGQNAQMMKHKGNKGFQNRMNQ